MAEARGLQPLTLRILSAVVLIPAVVAAVWLGGWALAALTAAAAVAMLDEWRRMALAGSMAAALPAICGVVAALALTRLDQPVAGLLVLLLTAALAALPWRRQGAGWAAFGVVYVGLPCLALLWLRDGLASGFAVLMWILLTVWASDTGAYAAGRLIGGPKLAPRISPNKTWSGALGGLAGAGLVGLAMGGMGGLPAAALLLPAGIALAAVAQAGDLLESALKRRFGVKDSGTLIPGHGGLLDRVDSLLLAVPAAALAVLLVGGGMR